MSILKSIALKIPSVKSIEKAKNRWEKKCELAEAQNTELSKKIEQLEDIALLASKSLPKRRVALKNVKNIEELGIELFVHESPDVISECIHRFGHWEATETKYVLNMLRPGDVVIDLGANIGYYTAIFSRKVGNTGKVFSFEPDDENYKMLFLNISKNELLNVTAFKAAVGESSGLITLHLHEADNRGAHMTGRVDDSSFGHSAFHPQLALDQLYEAGALDHVDFIKMDTQGAEPLIIKGSRKIIENNRNHLTMIVEFTPSWIEKLHNIKPIDFYKQICDMGFVASYIDTLKDEIVPVSDINELIETVNKADGITWQNRADFVDLIFAPKR
jgi:FkbM family methyltransferase